MEDSHLAPPDSTPSAAGSDATLQRKHAAMLERLSNLHQSRVAQKPNSETDSIQSFLNRFTESKLSIESQLSRISQTSSSSYPSNSPKPELENVAVSISTLEKLVAESSYLLPSYEVRTCLKTISDLKQSLDDVTSRVIPKKKFSFKNKKKAASAIYSIPPPPQSDVVNEESDELPKLGSENVGFVSPGFRAKENEVLVKEFNRDFEIGEFTLSDLKGCEVRLKGCLRAFFVNKLKDCKVFVGPVFGSVLIEEVEGCVFVLASHQIRIHNAKKCDFYLRVRSRPIIEDSNGVRFGPYCLRYDGIEKDLEEANLSEETGNWANVDDFRWLRAVQSPNWSVLPENDRVEMVHIS
ncbi:hypothetical protein ACH5RR_012370 [Cinchona calisaya]|uniref:C-CAP/cofactor C-like domain-containing protein n=1 Tax=Cinchona calisaya TaxID=153742 RepID=A0ABD3A7J4_9GENT